MTCKPCAKSAEPKTHTGNIMRPPTARGTRGEATGPPTVVATGVRFSLKPLTGRELETSRQLYASATIKIVLHLNYGWKLTPKDWIERTSGPKTGRALNIGYIHDSEQLGLDTPILCGEGDLS